MRGFGTAQAAGSAARDPEALLRAWLRTDWVVISLVGFLTSACGAILVACGVWWDLSVNFDCAPWRVAHEEALAAAAKGTDPQSVPLTCPFYASEPAETQCGACGTVVSRSGLHEARASGKREAAQQADASCAALNAGEGDRHGRDRARLGPRHGGTHCRSAREHRSC